MKALAVAIASLCLTSVLIAQKDPTKAVPLLPPPADTAPGEQSGDGDREMDFYTLDLEENEARLKENPDSADAKRDVSISLEKLGGFLAKRGQPGDADRALGYFTRDVEMCEAQLKENPDSAEAKRDVSISLEKLGSLLAKRGQAGDADKALDYFTRGLELSDALLKANPDSAEARRDVSISLNRLGGLLVARGQAGDWDKAMGNFTRSLDIKEALLKANPDSAEAKRDVSISLERLGDLLEKRRQAGDVDKALDYFTRGLELSDALLKADPGSTLAARDVTVGLSKLGYFLAKRGQAGDSDRALGYFTHSLDMREARLKANPSSAEAMRDVLVTCVKIADLAEHTKTGEARKWWQRAYDLLAGMKEKGMYVSPKELENLETVRKKLNP